ncbi:glycosyltransferase [Bacteroides thetaiotaomicron]|uniref:Glycosyltransferase family 4 protein n=1 Tax=Bacteroides thetaiotaomicron TaxID=818 RepID=A0AAW4ZMA2_BACT4|nr:glycosyltransferase [Bacteroides thetaiotaomicron]MCE9241043.1 glycosyltransferase family 4 protein [Bacteroides thetaiotaomicron]MCE9270205.1 glycosyltransferase family 4 protein [Bacteroides thetaiotaomicron]MCE9279825.1 glycosyltransferase family 4 protein [Bacteroides thetaiotaomicron]MCE9294211.1 glycosyltransferase family 4 protein [Bacteroides thetaiotaomicron]MDC2233915.1 glycosyltransferase [Bacteroides thetaiotaomicron]
MTSTLFVFDHKYPKDDEGTYYYSSGFDQDFFSRYFQIFDRFDIFGRSLIIDKGIATPIDYCKFPTKITTIASNKKMVAAYSRLKNEILLHDAVICRMPSLFGALAINICRMYKIPYIVEIVACTYDALVNSPSWKRRLMAMPAELIYREVLKDNPYNVYVTKKFLQEKYPSSGTHIACSNVTLNEVDKTVLDKRMDKLSRFDKRGKIIIGTTSTLNVDFKGQKYVIHALPRLLEAGYDIEYQMVGDGDGAWLMDIATSLGVQNKVKIVGRLNHDDVFKWLDNIDVYVHPSCQEGLSRAIIEAMSRACPIVACDAGGIHELIEESFIVAKKDVEGMSNTLLRVLLSDMSSMAVYNFENSKEYVKSVLYKRREEYYHEFLLNNKLCSKK